jgi:membrane protease YdiL (CAAX protease family)
MNLMIDHLTEPLSKRLFFALLVITVGVEIVLYLSRYSYLASSLYDAIMVASFFIGIKLHRKLNKEVSKTRRQLWLQVTGAFLFFFIGSTVVHILSANVFEEYSIEYEEYVQEYTDLPVIDEGSMEPSWTILDEVDTVGYDIFSDLLAGLEEVWRLGYMVLLLLVFKRVFPKRWEEGSRDIFLMISLVVTSILFGIDHTLAVEASWNYQIGTIVTLASMGLLFGLILLWTRNLWVTVCIHSLYDVTVTISWYYYEFAVEIFAGIVLLAYIILLYLEKRERTVNQIESESIVR